MDWDEVDEWNLHEYERWSDEVYMAASFEISYSEFCEIAEQLGVSPRTVQRDIKALGARGSDESESERTSDPDFGIVVQEVGTGETWRGVDRESAPLGTCLEVAIDCIDQLRQRLDDPELVELAEAARGFVDSVVWRLMEGAAA